MKTEQVVDMAVWNRQGGWDYLETSRIIMSLEEAKKSSMSLLIITEVYEDGEYIRTKRYYSKGALNNDMVEK